jgi:hypothetical protein
MVHAPDDVDESLGAMGHAGSGGEIRASDGHEGNRANTEDRFGG